MKYFLLTLALLASFALTCHAQYSFFRKKPDAGLVVAGDFSFTKMLRFNADQTIVFGTQIAYPHVGIYYNLPLVRKFIASTELMYANYGVNYYYKDPNAPYNSPEVQNKERLTYLENNLWLKYLLGRFSLKAGLKTAFLLHASHSPDNLWNDKDHTDLFRRTFFRLMGGVEYGLWDRRVVLYLTCSAHFLAPMDNVMKLEGGHAYPGQFELRIRTLQVGTQVRLWN